MLYPTYKKQKKSVLGVISTIIFVLICIPLLFCVGVMFYCNNVLEYYPISGDSMQPLLNPNGINEDFVYISKSTNNISYGDIIIYSRQVGADIKLVIKRVIAKAGDNFMIKLNDNNEYRIFVQYASKGDFVELNEEYILDKQVYEQMYAEFYNSFENKQFIPDGQGNKYLHIQDDEIFYLGDNRTNSTDCIDYGAQKTDRIVGVVQFIIHQNTNRVWQVIIQILGIYKWK